MAGSLKTEAVVLRSMRYGEADRILHLYTPERGRLSAIAKGVRRAKSRFGGRLEPCFRLEHGPPRGAQRPAHGHGAETVAGHPRLREHAAALDGAARACDAVGADVRRRGAAPRRVQPALQPARAARRGPGARDARQRARLPAQAAAGGGLRAAALLLRGLRGGEHLVGFSGAAGGVVCSACEASAFPLGQEAHDFLVAALGSPLAEAPDAPPPALAQAERAILATLEHHAHAAPARPSV